jgi:hypothetical protein
MAYKWQEENDFPIVKRERLSFAEIGGIGQIVYKIVKYKRYELRHVNEDEDFNGEMYRPIYGEKPITSVDYGMTGLEILASICNLAKEYNKLPSQDNPRSKEDLIIKWCEENFHPYDIDSLYEAYRKMDNENERSETPNEYDGYFKKKDFIRDMQNVYNVFTFYFAYTELCDGRPEMAYNLYSEGFYFDTFPFFEEYKYDDWKQYIPPKDEDIKKPSSPEELLKEMMEDRENTVEAKLVSLEHFRKNVLKDKKRIYQLVCDMIPEINMVIKFDSKACKAEFTANVKSVFDICWYTIARLVAAHAPSQDEDMKSGKFIWDQRNIGVCLNCGRYFNKNSNRQLYCDYDECKRACNRNRQKEFQRRRKEKI